MLRLLSIEYYKLKNTRYFWILSGMFAFFLTIIPLGIYYMMQRFGTEKVFSRYALTDLPFFDFMDIWQNLTWIYTIFSVLLGLMIVINTANEFTNTTFRQNVIDGLSRQQYFYSKLSFIVIISALTSLLVLLIGLAFGYSLSIVTDFSFVIRHIEFIPAYFLHLVGFLLFCFVVALLIRKSGMAIAFVLFYIVGEFIISYSLQFGYGFTTLLDFLPMNGLKGIIRNPFTKYILRETETSVSLYYGGITLAYTFILYFIAQYLITKKDI